MSFPGWTPHTVGASSGGPAHSCFASQVVFEALHTQEPRGYVVGWIIAISLLVESSSSCCWLCCSGRWGDCGSPGSLHRTASSPCLAGIELLESGFMLNFLPGARSPPGSEWSLDSSWGHSAPEDWPLQREPQNSPSSSRASQLRVATSPTWWVTAGTGMWMVSLFTCHKHKKEKLQSHSLFFSHVEYGKDFPPRGLSVMEIGYVSRVLPKCLHKKFSQPHGGPFVWR